MTMAREPKVKLSTRVKPFIGDGDQHIYEPKDMWTSRVSAKWKDLVPQVVPMPYGGDGWRWEGGKWYQAMGLEVGAGRAYTDIKHYGHSFATTRRGCYEPKERLKDMDIDGVDKAIVFPSVGMRMRNTTDRELMLVMEHAYNEGIWEWCSEGDMDRLIPLFVLPDSGTEDAIGEFETCVKRGFKSFMFMGFPQRGGYPDPADDKIWARCQEAGIPACLHTGGPQAPDRAPFDNTDMNKPPTRLADIIGPGKSVAKGYVITWMTLTGVFERFPKLKLALVETGSGWLPFYYEQIDSFFYKNRTVEPFNKLSKPPSQYLKEQMWTTIMVDTYAIRNRHQIGVDKLMWSSDYPHSGYGSEFPNSRLFIEYQFRGVPDDELRKMLGMNFNDMLGLPNN